MSRTSEKPTIVPPTSEQDAAITADAEADERLDRGEHRLVRCASPANEGLVDWLLACPEKGFFVPIESELTDTL